jgi:predicted nucleic acid-binding protein
MTERSFVDTNIWVYRFDHGEPAKRVVAKRLLDKAEPGSLVVSTQVLQEFYVVTTRKLARPLKPEQASEAIERMSALPVVSVDVDFVRSGIDISRRNGLSLWDALIVEAAIAARCERILSEDFADGTTIEGVQVENPFRQ